MIIDLTPYGFEVVSRMPATEAIDVWSSAFNTALKKADDEAVQSVIGFSCFSWNSHGECGASVKRNRIETVDEASSVFNVGATAEVRIGEGYELIVSVEVNSQFMHECHDIKSVKTGTFTLGTLKRDITKLMSICYSEVANKVEVDQDRYERMLERAYTGGKQLEGEHQRMKQSAARLKRFLKKAA